MTNKIRNEEAATYSTVTLNQFKREAEACTNAELLQRILKISEGMASDMLEDGRLRGPFKERQTLKDMKELVCRSIEEELQAEAVLTDPDKTRQYLSMKLADLPHEVFACIFLDNRHRVIAFEEMFRGTIDGASVYPREVVKAALHYNAAAVVFAHNHPSGVAEPSSADRSITERLTDALALVDIRVLDHLIVAANQSTSFAERGLL